MGQFKSVHWATEHRFNELADGMDAAAGDSNALCTADSSEHLSCISTGQ